MSTRAKWTARFRKFWSGDFRSLVEDIPTSSVQAFQSAHLRIPRNQLRIDNLQEDKNIKMAQKLANEGLISKAIGLLEASPKPQEI